MLPWSEVEARFASAANWWVATTGADGPHVAPVWGVVLDGVLCFYGEPGTVRSRNLAADPRLAIHLEDPNDVLILHGTATEIGAPTDHADICAAYSAKYPSPEEREWVPGEPGMEGVRFWAVTPVRALAWEATSAADWVNRRWRATDV